MASAGFSIASASPLPTWLGVACNGAHKDRCFAAASAEDASLKAESRLMIRTLSYLRERLRHPAAQNVLVILGLLALSVAIRLEKFASDFGRDESTFILVGQGLVDGHLPYTILWDNKPPLIFAFMALVIAVAGKSLVAIRLAGTLCLTAAAFATYLSGQRIWNRATGLLAACLVVIFVHLSPGGYAVTAELVALPALVGALSILVRPVLRHRDLFMAGALISVASLVRMNLGYVAAAVGTLLLVRFLRDEGIRRCWVPLSLYVAGGLLPLMLVVIPYAASGELGTLIDSMIKAPLSYASSRKPIIESFHSVIESGFDWKSTPLLLGFVGALGLLCRPSSVKVSALSTAERRNLAMLTCFGAATVWSIAGSGGAFGHYIIQAIPFLALPAARFYVALAHGRRPVVQGLIALTLLVMLYSSTEKIWENFGYKSRRTNEEKIALYIEKHNPRRQPVYLMSGHAAHWYLGTYPISKIVTHPTNISKKDLLPYAIDEKTTPQRELKKILAEEPLFIVTGKKTNLHGEAERVFHKHLKEHYRHRKTIAGDRIYERVGSEKSRKRREK